MHNSNKNKMRSLKAQNKIPQDRTQESAARLGYPTNSLGNDTTTYCINSSGKYRAQSKMVWISGVYISK